MRAASVFFSSKKRSNRLRVAFSLLLFIALVSFSAVFASEPSDFRILKKLMKEGAHTTALDQGKEYLSTYPEGGHRAQVAKWVGELLLENGEAKEALPLLKEAQRGLPPKQRIGLELNMAEALVEVGEPEKGLSVLKAIKPAGQGEAQEIIRLKIKICGLLDNPECTIKTMSQLPEDRRTPADRLALGIAMARTGKNEEASEVLNPLLDEAQLEPEFDREARLALATSLYHLKNYDKVPVVLSPLLEKGDVDAVQLEAWALHAQGNDARAYDLIRKAAPLKGWREARAMQAIFRAEAEADDEAIISSAARVAEEFPDNPLVVPARFMAADALERRHDYSTAFQVISTAFKILPEGRGNIDEALKAADLVWRSSGDRKTSAKWLSFAETLAGNNEDKALVKMESAGLRWKWGDLSGALKDLAETVSTYKKTSVVPDAYLLMGRMLLSSGDYGKARQCLEVVTDSFPDSKLYTEAALLLGESYITTGDPSQAEPALHLLSDAVLSPDQTIRYNRLKGLFHQSKNEWADAAVSFSLTTVFPDSGEIYDEAVFRTALSFINVGSPEAALDIASTIGDRRLATGIAVRCAELFMKGDDRERGFKILEKIAKGDDKVASVALMMLADGRLDADDRIGGMADLRRLAKRSSSDPLSILAQHRIEMMLLADKGAGAALRSMPLFRQSEPMTLGELDILLRSAGTRASAGRGDEAAKLYSKYLERVHKGKGSREAASYLAGRAMKRRDWGEAKRVLLETERTPLMNLELARASLGLRDTASASAALSDALEDPGGLGKTRRLEAEIMAATVARSEGKTAEAMKHYEYFAKNAPATASYKDSLLGAALWLRNRGQYESALEALGRLNKAFRDAAIGYNYGYTLELMGKPDEALKAYLKVAYTSSNAQWALTARYRAAERMLQMRRFKDARALYRELVARTRGTVQGKYAESRLKWLDSYLEGKKQNNEESAEKTGKEQKQKESKPTAKGGTRK